MKHPNEDQSSTEKSEQQQPSQLAPIEIPRLLMEREAKKKHEYAQRAKVDVREILNDKEVR